MSSDGSTLRLDQAQDIYDDTKKNLEKTGVKYSPKKRVKFDPDKSGKDYINSGSFGSVYRCGLKGFREAKNKQKAVKMINGESITNWRQICNELELQNICEKCPYVVELYTFCLDIKLNIWLVMEFCPTDLVKYTEKEVNSNSIKNGLCYSDRLDQIYDKCYQALEFIHDENIIHRDLKPENILLTFEYPDGSDTSDPNNQLEIPKLCDFGIATKQRTDEEQAELDEELANESLAFRQGMSKKTVIGTNLFMAGEMFTGNYDETVDIYALTLSYYQCKTYTKEKGEAHWTTKMVTPITYNDIEEQGITFSSEKNYKAYRNILVTGTATRAVERPSAQQIRERLENKYLALLASTGRAMGLNPKKPSFKRKLFMYFGLPLIILTVLIVMVTLKCPDDRRTAEPWKPKWFGGCEECGTYETLVKEENLCRPNECLCDYGEVDNTTCLKDGEQHCQKCNDGFHLVEENIHNKTCVVNRCKCDELVKQSDGTFKEVSIGVPNIGTDMKLIEELGGSEISQCNSHMALSCNSCENGRHLVRVNSYTSFCLKNQCECQYGDPAVYTECFFHEAKHCASCHANTDYVLKKANKTHNAAISGLLKNYESDPKFADFSVLEKNGVVESYWTEYCEYQPKQCSCDNGVGAQGPSCPEVDFKTCDRCDQFYHKKERDYYKAGDSSTPMIWHCEKNVCTCDGGTPVDDCPVNGMVNCKECDYNRVSKQYKYKVDGGNSLEATRMQCEDPGQTLCESEAALGSHRPDFKFPEGTYKGIEYSDIYYYTEWWLGRYFNNREEHFACKYTETINLSRTEISDLPEFYFFYNHYLKELRLARNSIPEIKQRLFEFTREIQIIDLSHNKLTSISIGLFNNNKNLEELYLNNNLITEIDITAFMNLPDEIPDWVSKILEPEDNRKRRSTKDDKTDGKKKAGKANTQDLDTTSNNKNDKCETDFIDEPQRDPVTSIKKLHLYDNEFSARPEYEKQTRPNLRKIYRDIDRKNFILPNDSVQKCLCDFGSPSVGDDCPEKLRNSVTLNHCASCDAGRHLDKESKGRQECLINECTCKTGQPAKGLSCPSHNDEKCTDCSPPYYIDKNDQSKCSYRIDKNDWYSFITTTDTYCRNGT